MNEPDYIRTVLESFCEATGRLNASPADYAQAQTWGYAGIPLSVAWRGIQDKLMRSNGKRYVRTMPLSWCDDDVVEVFNNWRRAIGPSWRQHAPEVNP